VTPAWSPKGDQIAYAGEVNGILQIFTKRVGAPAPTQITRQDQSCFSPMWTPDGARLYYIVHAPGTRPSLWSIGVAGGLGEKVRNDVLGAALARDGRTMAMLAADSGRSYRLMLASPPTAEPRPYGRAPIAEMRATTLAGSLDFTRDGKYLGLYSAIRSPLEFWKIPLDGGEPLEMLQGRDIQGSRSVFTWTQDGLRIIAGRTYGLRALDSIDLRSHEVRAITPSGVEWDGDPALSPDGRILAFVKGENAYDVVEAPLDGSPQRDVIATSRNEVAPTQTPDGMHFAYGTDRSGSQEIWLRNRRDGSERLIVSTRDFDDGSDTFVDCEISPDGKRIAYRRTHANLFEIWISSLSGDTPVRLYDDPAKASQRGPSWSPDGNWIAYYSDVQGKTAVMKTRVGSNVAEVLTLVERPAPVRWSPRGDWIAWDDGGKLKLVSPDGKEVRTISGKAWYTYGWSRDGTAMYGITFGEGRRLIVGRIDLQTARETRVADLGTAPAAIDFGARQGNLPYRGFSMHPDGKSFLTSVLRVKGDVWLLENFERPR
jgi:Tol biopolymer transport system component